MAIQSYKEIYRVIHSYTGPYIAIQTYTGLYTVKHSHTELNTAVQRLAVLFKGCIIYVGLISYAQ